MKRHNLVYLAMLLTVFANAQQNPVAAGGIATGNNGSVSFSIGQLVDESYTSGNYTITQGLQQPYEVVDPLPLQLLSFTAMLKGKQTLLNWKTTHEQNTNHFELERKLSKDNSFSFLAAIKAKGTSSEALYQYADNLLTAGVTYYRLKEVDNNGLNNYSQVVLVNFQTTNTTTLKVYPNPVLTQMNIVFNAVENKTYQLQLVDALGRTVISKQVACQVGSNTINWNVAQLTAGDYTLKALGTAVSPIKIIKNN